MLNGERLAVLMAVLAYSRLRGAGDAVVFPEEAEQLSAEPSNGTRVWRPVTFDFVDAVVHAVNANKTRTVPPFTSQPGYGVAQTILACRELQTNASAKFARFAESQHSKYSYALAGYDLYRRSHGRARRLYDYILGVSGYWELRAAEQNTTLLSSACQGLPRRWRDARVINGVAAGRPFASLTATFGDLLVGATSFLLRQEGDGPAASFLWGQYQEAAAQAALEEVFSGSYLDGVLPADRNANPRVPFSLASADGAPSRPLSYAPQVVWHALTVDILAWGTGEGPAELERLVEEQGRRIVRMFVEQPGSRTGGGGAGELSLLNATRQMLAKAEAVAAVAAADIRRGSDLAGWAGVLESKLPAALAKAALAKAAMASGEAGGGDQAKRLQENVTAAVNRYWTSSGGKGSGRQMVVAPAPLLRAMCKFYASARADAAAAGYMFGAAGAAVGALSCHAPAGE